MSDRGGLEELFRRLRAGDQSARDELFDFVYAELHRQASSLMSQQRPGHTLQPTALVNEAYFRLCGDREADYADRQHFLRVAGMAMKQILVDHARRRAAGKRTTPKGRVDIDRLVDDYERSSGGLLNGGLVALGDALKRLEQRDPELVRLIELRYFVGYDVAQTAAVLGISPRTVARQWKAARLFLRAEMER